ncbi:MAG: 3-methyl-2-oxobutanoate hydroxymethyltransferase [Chlamydiales bacterium]
MQKVTLQTLFQLKEKQEKIAALTAYDALFAKLMSQLGIELIIVGNSLGVTVLGYETVYSVTLDHMIYHTQACNRLKPSAFIVTDMPFQTYPTKEEAVKNAAKLIQAGCEMVKLEGGAFLAETIHFLTERGIPVCSLLGLMPQYAHAFGGYRLDTKKKLELEEKLIHDSKVLEEAGANLLVLHCVTTEVAQKISKSLTIPVIGIGSGPFLDGQVQILHDLLGFSDGFSSFLSDRYVVADKNTKQVRYTRDFLSGQTEGLKGAIKNYVQAVKQGQFPKEAESFQYPLASSYPQ